MILYGSNLGDANGHSTTNLPTLSSAEASGMASTWLSTAAATTLLPNLFVSMLQRLGIEEKSFWPPDGYDARIENGLSCWKAV